MTWCFEDRTTVRYQIQEMLRVERIFESDGIQGELDAYNPLIPDGSNWKVTLLLEYPDPGAAPRRAREADRRGGSLLGAGERNGARVRHRRRGSGARERRQDLRGAFSALRTVASMIAPP